MVCPKCGQDSQCMGDYIKDLLAWLDKQIADAFRSESLVRQGSSHLSAIEIGKQMAYEATEKMIRKSVTCK